MKDSERTEIIRDNRVVRLLWFFLGFICAAILNLIKHY
jgi:hypothetical protein